MKFDLKGSFTLSADATSFKKDIGKVVSDTNSKVLKKDSDEKSACSGER